MEDEASSVQSPPLSSTDASSSPVFGSRSTHAAAAASAAGPPAPASSRAAASVSAVLCDEEIAGWAEVRGVEGGCVDCAVNLSLRRSSGKAVHELLERAARSGLRELLLIGGTLAGSAACLKLAEAPEFRRHGVLLYAAVGVHPLEAHSWTATTQAELTLLLSHPLCVAVGETGLDFHAKPYSRPPARGLQRWVFARHIELARRSGKPLFLHERGAGAAEGVLAALDAEQFPWSACVLHCFSNSAHVLQRILARGMRVAVSGHAATRRHDAGVTLRHALKRHAARSPAHRAALLGQMMVETDSPHLVPDAVHGALRAKQRGAAGDEDGAGEEAHGKPAKLCNEPAYLPAVLRAVADLVDATPAEVAASTAAVARSFFGFRSADDAHARDYLMTQADAVGMVSGEVKEGGGGMPPPAAPSSSCSSSSGDGAAAAATLAPRRPPAVCPAWSQPVHEMCVLEVSRENAGRRQRLREEWAAEEAAAAAAAAAAGGQEEAEAASLSPPVAAAASGGDAAHCFFDADRAAFVRRWRRGRQGGRASPEPAAASQATVFTNIASLGLRVVECTRAVAAAAGEELVADVAGGEERVELAADLDLSLGTEHRFLVPQELSKLCKQMRGVGLDTVLAESTRLPQMAQQAEAEGRLLVMRHAKNLDQHVHGALREVKWVRLSCEAAAQQMRQILTLFGISPEKSDLQKRCCVCNAKEWIRERGEDVKDEVEETVWREHPKLWRCGGCRKLFWNGGIYKKAKAHFTAMYLNGGGTGGRGGSQPRSGTSTPSAPALDVEGAAVSSPSASPPTDATPPPPTPTLTSPPPKEAEGEEVAPAAAAAAEEEVAATSPQEEAVEEDGKSTATSATTTTTTTTTTATSAPRRGKGTQRKARRAKRIAADAAAAAEGAAPRVHPQRPRPVSTKEITPANVSKLLGKKELHVVLVHPQHGVALFQGTDAVATAVENASVSAPAKPAAAAAAVAAKPAATGGGGGGGGGGGRTVWGLPYTRVLPTPLAVRDFAEELRAAQEADPEAPPRAAAERLWQTWVDAALRRLLALCVPSVAARLPAAEMLGSEGSAVHPAVGAERGDPVEIGKKRFFVLRLRDTHSVPPGADGGRPPDSGEPFWLSSFAQFRFRAGYEKAAEALRSHTQGGDLLSCEAVRRLCAAGYLRRPPLEASGEASGSEEGDAEAQASAAAAATAARLDGLGAMHASAAFRHAAWAAARRSGAAHASALRRLHRKGVPAQGVTPVRLSWEVDTAAVPAPEVPLDAASGSPEDAREAAARRRTAEAAGAWLARVAAKDAAVAAVAETTRAAIEAVTGAASVRVFGSAAAGAADPSRFDVDLYLEAGESAKLALLGHVAVPPEDRLSRREAEGFYLLDAAAALRGADAAAGIADVEEVLAARVPVVRASVKGVPVDLTVRFLGCANTALFSEYMRVCPVVRPLFLVLKRWASWSGVRQVATDAGHLTSYALQLLMLYALVRKGVAPAVPLTGENGTDYVQAARRRAAAAAPAAAVFPDWEEKGVAATEEVLRLFGVFLRFYATEFDWDAHVVCVRSVGVEVPPVSKEEAGWAEACCCVRDPFECDLNLAKRESAKARTSLTRRFALSLAALNSGEMEALFAEA